MSRPGRKRRKLTSSQVLELRRLYTFGVCIICGQRDPKKSINALAKEFGISKSYCADIINYKYYWEVGRDEYSPHLRSGPRATS